MGWRLLLSHLAELESPAAIHDTHSSDEGMVSCYFSCKPSENEPPITVNIQLCASNLDEYPHGNSFMIFTTDESHHQDIPNALGELSARTYGQILSTVLEDVSQRLTKVITCTSDLHNDIYTQPEESDFEFEEDSDVDFEFVREPTLFTCGFGLASRQTPSANSSSVDAERLRSDLIILKQAGFRYGVLGNLERAGILCVSLRLAKLGLSEEAMEAWSLKRKHYLLLMIAYPQGYRDIDQVKQDPTLSGLTQMRVGLCDHYKPQLAQVLPLFPGLKSELFPDLRPSAKGQPSVLEPLFIDKPLNELLRDHLPAVIKARLGYDLSWFGAEQWVQAMQAASSIKELCDISQFETNDATASNSSPTVATADHLAQAASDCLSLPLVAMQFVLRHLSRCTEFCLVCHSRLDDSFGALKPYVCEKPLCLYQYMSLGFGPSIEREIVSQPAVVDLLIGFCFFASEHKTLNVLPAGMGLLVPIIPRPVADASAVYHHAPIPKTFTPPTIVKESFSCLWKLEEEQNLIYVTKDASEKFQSLRPGSWVFLVSDGTESVSHCRVKKVDSHRAELEDVVPLEGSNQTPTSQELANAGVSRKCYMYEYNFDDLPDTDQHHAIHTLMKTFPSVEDMRQYLLSRGPDAMLRDWTAKMSNSAVNLLRWIIASNTSSIVQLNQLDKDGNFQNTGSVQNRVGGMEEWIQFRFAQGAPDKEKRFMECVRKECPESQHPTLFGWHGSSVYHWHSIIRQGLRFDSIVNGRAFGNGVYLSPHARTSLSFSRARLPVSKGWGKSNLQILSALSLSEVVNQPAKFVHNNPHYVVSDVDWIQTRYLFVKSTTPTRFPGQPSAVYVQDPSRRVYNENSQPITIPITAISKSRRPGTKIESDGAGSVKRSKLVVETDQATAERLEDDADSIVSDDEDLALLRATPDTVEDCEAAFSKCNGLSSPQEPLKKKGNAIAGEGSADTDFIPGSLDVSGIQFLAPPKDATRASTQALMRSFREVLAVQEDTALFKLGWYIDSDLVVNMYQWIVELHSFPPNLPLSKDMKAAGLTSVVLEIRFPNSYPFAPPFIRVVKPRFLPFGQGGGGNVTEGGAMCMEILTNTGWTAAQAIDGLLLQVRMAILDEERPARLASRGQLGGARQTYGIGEAVAAYIRACKNHGWTVPDGFEKMGQS